MASSVVEDKRVSAAASLAEDAELASVTGAAADPATSTIATASTTTTTTTDAAAETDADTTTVATASHIVSQEPEPDMEEGAPEEDAVAPAVPVSENAAEDEDEDEDEPLEAEPLDAEDAADAADPTSTADTDDEPDDRSSETRLDEHDSLVTVRLSEPPVLSVDTNAVTRMSPSPQEDDETGTPTASRRSTMSAEGNGGNSNDGESDDEEVDWDQLQRNEDAESNNNGSDNTAMLLARLEQENAKLATNPKSVRVQSPEPAPQPRSSRRVRPPSMAQLRDMVHGPTPSALRYSMIPPPPLTDLEFYAALVQDYHQTAARLPTLLSNKIHKGIPPPLRGVVWQSITGATRDTALAEQYERFCDATSPYEVIIGKDLGRSFPGVDMFREPDGDGQRMLGSVLRSYSLHEPRIGYCQGLAFLVGPLLMHMPDKEAFCVLVKLMENYDLRSSYMPDLAGLHVRIFQFRELLRVALPELSSHLDALQVDPAAYVSQWFLSFFAVTCPLPMLFRMYDVVFAEGAAETIMRVALSLMQKNQARLLACAELEDAMQLLLSRGLWDCYHYNANEFVLHFLSQSNIVTRDRLALLEQAYRGARIGKINQTDGAIVDRSSTIATVASRFLGRLWPNSAQVPPPPPPPPPSSSSLSASLSTATATASAPPSSSFTSIDKSTTPSSSNGSPLAHPRTTSSPPASGATAPPASLSLGVGAGLNAAPLRPLSMLQRSASKNSIASTIGSMEAASSAAGSSATSSSSSSVLSSASTDATTVSRDSAAELNGAPSNKRSVAGTSNKQSDNERYLNSQIEDLLTALTDMQRQHALLADQLQREQEERSEDRKTVQALVQVLRDKAAKATLTPSATPVGTPEHTLGPQLGQTESLSIDGLAATTPRRRAATSTASSPLGSATPSITPEEFLPLLELMEARFGLNGDNRQSEIPQTKSQLRMELARAKEQLSHELAKDQDNTRRVYETEQEMNVIKEQLRESHARARTLLQDKQRLERQIQILRARVAADTGSSAESVGAGSAPTGAAAGTVSNGAQGVANAATEWFGRATGVSMGAGASGNVGLRELKLSRSKSTPSKSSYPSASGSAVRSSSLTVRGVSPGRPESIAGRSRDSSTDRSVGEGPAEQPQEALVLELVQAKTAEAVARQEAEEAKQKLESLRKAMGLSPSNLASILQSAGSQGGGGSGSKPAVTPPAVAAAPATASGYGSFFGWRR